MCRSGGSPVGFANRSRLSEVRSEAGLHGEALKIGKVYVVLSLQSDVTQVHRFAAGVLLYQLVRGYNLEFALRLGPSSQQHGGVPFDPYSTGLPINIWVVLVQKG